MWGRKVVQEVAPVPPAPISLEPAATLHSVALCDEEYAGYESTCKSLGFVPAPLIYQRLVRFLKQEGIKTIPYDNVVMFLNRMYPHWSWRVLRPQDASEEKLGSAKVYGQNHISMRMSGQVRDFESEVVPNGGFILPTPYKLPVPLTVLMVAGQVAEAVPEIQLLVSDFIRESDPAPKNPDPFLAVRIPGSLEVPVIIAHWDEPGFSDTIAK